MAGDYQVMRVNVARAGVIFAETLEELGDIAEIALRCQPIPVGGVAMMGESGAVKALVLDLCEELGLALPHVSDDNSPPCAPPYLTLSAFPTHLILPRRDWSIPTSTTARSPRCSATTVSAASLRELSRPIR